MPIGLSGDPESLFCSMLQSQYQLIVATLEAAIMFPLQALQLVKSSIQMLQYVVFVAVDIVLTKIENWISEMFDLENVGLENARRNFCKIAYSCKILTDYLFGASSPLKAMGFSDAELAEMKNNYTKFEEIVCNKSFKGLLDQFKTAILGDVSRLLDEAEDKIANGFLKLDKITAKYNALLEEYHVFDYLDKLNDFAECAFAACNFIATSDNKQSDVADKMKLTNSGGTWIIDPNFFAKINAQKEEFQVRIDKLREQTASCANKEPNPNDGVNPDDIAK
jgi:hypothetical protein